LYSTIFWPRVGGNVENVGKPHTNFLKKTLRNHFDEIEQKRKQQSEIKFQKVVNKHTEEGKYEELPLMSDTTVRKSSKKSMFPYITTK